MAPSRLGFVQKNNVGIPVAAQNSKPFSIRRQIEGKITPKAQAFCRVGFTTASERHLEDRTPHLAPKSVETEKERLKPLQAYFKEISLLNITPDMLRSYISERRKNGVANKTINLEIGVVRSVLKRAKRWHLLADDIKPLPAKHRVGRALEKDQKLDLARLANTNPDWQNARLTMILALNTTMRSCEVKGLQWRDVDFMERTITIRESKTDAGRRLIPLNRAAWARSWSFITALRNRKHENRTILFFPLVRMGKLTRLSPREAGVRLGEA